MGRFLGGIFSNDSVFGQIMTRIGILVGANLIFVLFAFPLVTAGPALTALFYVMLKVLRGEHELNPFKTFFRAFISNFKQAIICWLVYMAIMVVAYLDYRFLKTMGGPADILKIAVAVVAIAVTVVMLFLPPVMAAFADTIPNLLRNAVFFAVKNPLRLIAVAACVGIPAAISFLHIRYHAIRIYLVFLRIFSYCDGLLCHADPGFRKIPSGQRRGVFHGRPVVLRRRRSLRPGKSPVRQEDPEGDEETGYVKIMGRSSCRIAMHP